MLPDVKGFANFIAFAPLYVFVKLTVGVIRFCILKLLTLPTIDASIESIIFDNL